VVFAMSVDSYQVLPEWAVLAVARTLPWSELILSVLLAIGIWLRYTSLAAAAVLGLFFVMMLIAYGRGLAIDCGCFGFGEQLSPRTLARDGLLLAAAFTLAFLAARSRHPSAAR
jgi:putative oxidoreductase